MVRDRSALPEATVVVTVVLLFAGLGSAVAAVMVGMLMIDPDAPGLTRTTRVKVALPAAKRGLLQTIAAAPVVHVHPGAAMSETKLVVAG